MVIATLPSLPRGQINDPRTGQISQAWRQFFHDLWIRTGGGQDAVGDAEAKLENLTSANDGEILFNDNGIINSDDLLFWDKATNRVFVGGNTIGTAKAIIESTGSIIIQDDSVLLKFGIDQDAGISYDGTNLVINPKIVGSGFVVVAGKLRVDEELEITGDLAHNGTNLGLFGVVPTPVQTGFTTFANLTTVRTLNANATTLGEVADVLGTLIEDLKAKGLISA